jgi:hypothetical protein
MIKGDFVQLRFLVRYDPPWILSTRPLGPQPAILFFSDDELWGHSYSVVLSQTLAFQR